MTATALMIAWTGFARAQASRGGTPPKAALEDASKAAAALPRLHSLLVSRGSELVLERYFRGAGVSRLANLKSASKSVISALIGIAIERKLIPGVTAPIAPYFPELGAGTDERKQKITIEDLLTMRSGLESTSIRNYGAWVKSPNWVRYILTRPVVSQPGGEMIYSTGNFHLLSAILTKVSKRGTWEFASDVLAKPLGITLARWPQDPQGIYFGGNEMLMTPRQMAIFGELYLHRGLAKGRQIVPPAWVEASWTPRTISPWSEQFYGYGWWMRQMAGRQVYFAWGYGGQFIFIVPELDLVVVTTSSPLPGEERHNHTRAIHDLVERLITSSLAGTSK